jgi:hypothetical protein
MIHCWSDVDFLVAFDQLLQDIRNSMHYQVIAKRVLCSAIALSLCDFEEIFSFSQSTSQHFLPLKSS